MANSFVASRAQLIYALCLPLAVLMGYFLAAPTDVSSVAIVVALVSLLLVPVFMKYYHPLLIGTWNAAITPYFIPGSPHLWMLLAAIGFGFAVVNRFTNPESKIVEVTWINRTLAALLLVVCATAMIRGGIGVRVMGSATYGGKHYIYVLTAIFGYYAIISQRIPIQRAGLYVGIFFLSALTALIPNLVFLGGSGLYFLYFLFPAFLAQEQALAAYGYGGEFTRLTGLTFASMGFYCWLLARYGLRNLFDWKRPWRGVLFVIAGGACLFTGFRSFLLLFLITVVVQFCLERLFKTKVIFWVLASAAVGAALLLPHTDKMPGVVQRSLSFLPINISPAIRQDVSVSSNWRLRMWHDLTADLPKYFFLGKGYAIDPGELNFAQENARRGFAAEYSEAMIAGDYHNGPLTLYIPFGIWGILAFGAFLVASLRYLVHQYKHGDPELKTINCFILTFFTARLIYFLAVFGAFSFDLFVFTGLIALSVSLNGPIKPEEEEAKEETEESPFENAGWNGT